MRLRQVAGVLAVVALAGCGSAPALLTAGHGGGPPSATRAGALRLAKRMIAGNVLPPGARGLPQRPVPAGLRQVTGQAIGVTAVVDVYRLLALPVSMTRAAAFLARHAPAGTHGGGVGESHGGNRVIEMDVSYFPDRLPRGVSSASLIDTIVPAPHGGSLLREDAQVIWHPGRSAAEYLAVRDYRAVRVNAGFLSPVRHVTRTFTARGVIGRLARLLNGLPASSGGLVSCPIEIATYQLIFEPVAGQPKVVVGTQGCPADTVTVGGARQPALEDFGKLTALIGKIMHVQSHGAAVIERLLGERRLERVTGAHADGSPWLDRAREAIAAARLIEQASPDSAHHGDHWPNRSRTRSLPSVSPSDVR